MSQVRMKSRPSLGLVTDDESVENALCCNEAMSTVPTVRVNRKAADRVSSGHPWIFSSDVLDRGTAQGGDAVKVIDNKGKLIGTAHYSSTSQITLRLLSKRAEIIDEVFLRASIETAYQFRQ